ncbi:MAG: hypothetical protein ACREQY_08885, partial [Candidatus Binatia bacterium]
MIARPALALGAALLAVPLPILAVSDGHFDVDRQGCEASDYSYDQKDVPHSGDGCETITVQAGPAEANDYVRAGVDHEQESVSPHSGSVKLGPADAGDQGRVYVPWGVSFYQDPHPAAPDRFGPE